MLTDLPIDWQTILDPEMAQPYFTRLARFVDEERAEHTVFPPEPDVFNAFKLSTWQATRVLILGQDPYHDDGQAHGLCFSVQPGVRPPPSLNNIFVERRSDLDLPPPASGDLTPWARQGIVMLNAVLTVRAHAANSHKGHGWEVFTDAVIRALSDRPEPCVFVLWGAYAQKKQAMIDRGRHAIIASAHPSPLSARSGFFGSRPFSRINDALRAFGYPEIDWTLPEDLL
ncbi:MAG: uracil-DNA glycosylase [Capsulimonadaceae bacterium]